MSLPSIWPSALSSARVCTPAEAKRSITRLSRLGPIALREALVLFAVSRSGLDRPDIGRLEKMTNANAASIFFTAESLTCKGYVKTDRNDNKHVFVELTEKGKELAELGL